MALGLPAVNVNAWDVSGIVSCPNGGSAAGIKVYITGVGSTFTSANNAFDIILPDTPGSYTICVDSSTLPPGASVSGCVDFSTDANNPFPSVNLKTKRWWKGLAIFERTVPVKLENAFCESAVHDLADPISHALVLWRRFGDLDHLNVPARHQNASWINWGSGKGKLYFLAWRP